MATSAYGGTMKARLLLTTALFLFVQIPTMQGQVTVDVIKITCQQIVMGALPWTQRDVVLWLSGYYHGKRNSAIVEPETNTKDEEKVIQDGVQHRDTAFLENVDNVRGLGDAYGGAPA